MYQNIRNIIFDFGGVLLDIDYQLSYDALSNLLHIAFDPDDLPDDIKKVLFDFETGSVNLESFIWYLQRLSRNQFLPEGHEIQDAWNAMLIGWDPRKFAFLSDLKKKYNIFLLSNTNEIHLTWVYKDLKDHHGIVDFDDHFFNKTYYSHLLGMRKPNQDLFRFVQADANLIPSETLFIDDIQANVQGGASLGWNTYHHNPKSDLINIFKNQLKLL